MCEGSSPSYSPTGTSPQEPLARWLRQTSEQHLEHGRAFGFRCALEAFADEEGAKLVKRRRRPMRRAAAPEDAKGFAGREGRDAGLDRFSTK